MEDHVEAIRTVGGCEVDEVYYAMDPIPEEVLKRYEAEDAYPVPVRDQDHDYIVNCCSLLDFSSHKVRHDPEKLRRIFDEVFAR